MPSRFFVISGCAHADLDLPAKVFSALDVPCGHEEIFHAAAFERSGTLLWPQGVAGDASWFAAPVLDRLPESSVVMHQVRDPLSNIQELLNARFFERETQSRYFAEDFFFELMEGEHVVRCMRYWLEWNRLIEATSFNQGLIYRRYRVEDFSAHRAAEQLALVGLQRDAGRARRAIDALRAAPLRCQVMLTWNDLPDIPLTAELKATAESYGYRTSRRSVPRAFTV